MIDKLIIFDREKLYIKIIFVSDKNRHYLFRECIIKYVIYKNI